MKISKIVRKLGLFLAAYLTYAIVLNLPVFDAKPSELVLSYQQGEALSAEHYRRLGLEYLDRDAEEVGRERFALSKVPGERLPARNNEIISALSTGAEGRPISSYSTDLAELTRIAAMDENVEVFDSAAWQELNLRLENTDWQGLGSSSLDSESFYYLSFELGSLTSVNLRLWQLIYIIRNQDEVALAEWSAQQMELVEYPNTLIDLALASLFSPEVIQGILDLEFLSAPTRSALTAQISAFIQRVESNRGTIWAEVRERETRFGAGWLMTVSDMSYRDAWGTLGVVDPYMSIVEFLSLVFFQPQRFTNRLVEDLDRLQHGALSCPNRLLIERILWPQNLLGEVFGEYHCDVINMMSSQYPRYEERWNNYVDSLVEFRVELSLAQ